MKRIIFILLTVMFFSCNDSASTTTVDTKDSVSAVSAVPDTMAVESPMQSMQMTLKNGEAVTGMLVATEELAQAKADIEAKGISLLDCCGQEFCRNGYIWTCYRANDNKCYIYKTDWKCN